MGFRAPNDHRVTSVLADHVVCEFIEPSFRALERPDLANDSCYLELVSELETEIGWAFSGQASVDGLLASIYASSRATAEPKYVELLTSEIEMSRFVAAVEPSVKIAYPELLSSEIEMNGVFANPSAGVTVHSRSTGVPTLSEADIAEIELDRGFGTTSSPQALIESILNRSRPAGLWPSDLFELSETDVN